MQIRKTKIYRCGNLWSYLILGDYKLTYTVVHASWTHKVVYEAIFFSHSINLAIRQMHRIFFCYNNKIRISIIFIQYHCNTCINVLYRCPWMLDLLCPKNYIVDHQLYLHMQIFSPTRILTYAHVGIVWCQIGEFLLLWLVVTNQRVPGSDYLRSVIFHESRLTQL